ncbi:hypothetical protein SNOG_12807 [Parastagonospora nodorum SN15]|uniref:Uncharacterized protein n=1 Tax=Phaeosphaeria nodorum (strain SN15 / ATCC MYA-4574 / FGSC 10173) TaxID=321614 RepID=Q0U607_PHANO|nr:hypothetical protein SNOG_12807 [Parastagonospora nodorum SN15]EAT79607.1 hypothetical protein SNOG_12807 [Parastagonospora nodorum SN15]
MTRDHGRDKAFHDGGRVRISVQDAQERTWHSQSRGETGERFGALAALVVVSVGKSAATSLLCRSQQERGDVDTSRKGVVLHRKFSGGILSAHLRLKAANFAQPPEVSLASTELLVVKARPRPMSGARFAYLVHGRRVQLRTWNVQQLHQESVFQQSRQHASRPGRVDTLLSPSSRKDGRPTLHVKESLGCIARVELAVEFEAAWVERKLSNCIYDSFRGHRPTEQGSRER